jgi:hypothetical protein
MPQDDTDFERYFRDPKIGDGVLASGSSGLACKNIRLALRFLGFHEDIARPRAREWFRSVASGRFPAGQQPWQSCGVPQRFYLPQFWLTHSSSIPNNPSE